LSLLNPRTRKVLEPGKYYSMDNGSAYYLYAGVFQDVKEVPPHPCLFVVGNRLYRRKLNPTYAHRKKRKKKVTDNSRLLDATIRDEDNDLMVIIKQLLAENMVTTDQFKSLFDNVSDMNNMRRAIECGGQGNFSWNRFKQMIEKLNYVYRLNIRRASDVISNDIDEPMRRVFNEDEKKTFSIKGRK